MVFRTAEQSEGKKTVGVDPTVITARESPDHWRTIIPILTSLAGARKLEEKIKKKGGAGLVGEKTNLVDIVWGPKRPLRPQEKVKSLALEFTGKKAEEKIEDLRKELEKKKSAGLIICMRP